MIKVHLARQSDKKRTVEAQLKEIQEKVVSILNYKENIVQTTSRDHSVKRIILNIAINK